MKKKILLMLTIILIGSFGINVYADIQPYGDTYLTQQFWGDTGLNHIINFSGSPSASHSTIILYNDAGKTYRDYVYFIVVGCRHGNDITGAISTRSTGGKIGQMSIYNSQEACNDGYQGKITYIQYQVTKWGEIDDTGEELIADANASLYGNNYLYVINKYFANEDQLSLLIQGQSNYNLIQEQINQSITNTNTIMNQNHTYNNNPSENITGQNNVNEMTNAEENLMNNLDFSGASEVNVSINPNSSNFIWNIVNRLREINPAIITLMTSILGIGIFKLILNR